MIKIKVLYTIVFISLIFSCKSGKIESENTYEIINSITKSEGNKKTKIYYKTTSSKYDGVQIANFLNKNTVQFNLCAPSFDRNIAELTQKEINLLKEKFKDVNSKKFDFSKIKNREEFTKRKTNSTVHISEPIKFRNGEFAIYYSEGRYGGEFTLLKIEKSNWKKVCSSMVWIE
ncbi:hypothetical protein [Christiangramia salexigens]|nr:hypothetical protein [Christiangramia salexigens]